MSIYKRDEGREQPYWPLGPFKVRLPLVHYKLESAELVQGLIMVVISLALIPHLEEHAGIPYEVALAIVFISYGVGNLLPALLGSPLVSGWITPALPLIATYLGDFEPGTESIQALIALNLLVFILFFVLGITKMGSKILLLLPNSIKSGVIIGAGVAALMGEIEPGGTVTEAPITMIIAGLLTAYVMFSQSFKMLATKYRVVRFIANYGIVPAMLTGIVIAWFTLEFPRPEIKWGITSPDFQQLWSYLPFSAGFPAAEVFVMAIPTAIVSYIIAYGDIIVGTTLTERANEARKDEVIDYSVDRLHVITAIRSLLMGLFGPSPGQAGPIWTAIQATVAERYTQGRRAMNSFFGGAGSFHLACSIGLLILPLVSFFQPYQQLALSITLLATAYVCIQVGVDELNTSLETGVAGIIAIVLAVHGALYALAVGVALHLLVEKSFAKRQKPRNEYERLSQ